MESTGKLAKMTDAKEASVAAIADAKKTAADAKKQATLDENATFLADRDLRESNLSPAQIKISRQLDPSPQMKKKALGGKSAIILLSHSTISFLALITISARRYHSQ